MVLGSKVWWSLGSLQQAPRGEATLVSRDSQCMCNAFCAAAKGKAMDSRALPLPPLSRGFLGKSMPTLCPGTIGVCRLLPAQTKITQ